MIVPRECSSGRWLTMVAGIDLPADMSSRVRLAAERLRGSERVMAVSHIDADGICAQAVMIRTVERLGKYVSWKSIPQLSSESVTGLADSVRKERPDLVVFTDLGTGQLNLIKSEILSIDCVREVLILDHHLPQDPEDDRTTEGATEVNPNLHALDGSRDLSGAGTAFLVALEVDRKNTDLSELAVVGASGDLQDYYGRGMSGVNREIVALAEEEGVVRVCRDLTFFGINTRPLPMLLEYTTEPYLPGLTGNREACYRFFAERGIPLKDDDQWRTWSDLSETEKKTVIQGLVLIMLEAYDDPAVVEGIIGDIYVLLRRPLRTEMRNAKEFSTLLNACGRNREPEVGVRVCLGSQEAYERASSLLHQHRMNLAQALGRLASNGYMERPGMYVVNDPLTPDTIIGIVIGMAQGARLVPTDRPVIGVCPSASEDSQMVKISGRAQMSLIERGVNLKEAFARSAMILNERHKTFLAEGGGHPMAAGAFVRNEYLDEYLDLVSSTISEMLSTPQREERPPPDTSD
ncbi:MAG: DHH family phosphoesterase [Candidatus Thorarchaeota archaeon]